MNTVIKVPFTFIEKIYELFGINQIQASDKISYYDAIMENPQNKNLKTATVFLLLIAICGGCDIFKTISYLHFINLILITMRLLHQFETKYPNNIMRMKLLLENWVGYALVISLINIIDYIFASTSGINYMIVLKAFLHYIMLKNFDAVTRKFYTFGNKMYKFNKSSMDKFQYGLDIIREFVGNYMFKYITSECKEIFRSNKNNNHTD